MKSGSKQYEGGWHMTNLPFVSVIVPVYNAEYTIEKLIRSLLNQTYQRKNYEIILVDNNSADKTREIIAKFPVKLFIEADIQSSYAARNRGIKNAIGEIIAFIDSDCIAEEKWIENGVAALNINHADLAGGKVEFQFSERKTASEIYDSITHLNVEMSIARIQSAGTVNLFVKSTIFSQIGFFPDDVRSGGDMQFTNRAVKSGYTLVFAPDARVFHPTRTFKELICKSYRVGTGCIDVLIGRGLKRKEVVCVILRDFLPPRPGHIRELIRTRGTKDMEKYFVQVFGIGYLNRVVCNLGMLSNIGKLFRKPVEVLT
jgi:glycosyltransferase AglE